MNSLKKDEIVVIPLQYIKSLDIDFKYGFCLNDDVIVKNIKISKYFNIISSGLGFELITLGKYIDNHKVIELYTGKDINLYVEHENYFWSLFEKSIIKYSNSFMYAYFKKIKSSPFFVNYWYKVDLECKKQIVVQQSRKDEIKNLINLMYQSSIDNLENKMASIIKSDEDARLCYEQAMIEQEYSNIVCDGFDEVKTNGKQYSLNRNTNNIYKK